jgi:hypothetical protein
LRERPAVLPDSWEVKRKWGSNQKNVYLLAANIVENNFSEEIQVKDFAAANALG